MDLGELLKGVQKPARYIGGEWNSVRKEWTDGRVKCVLAFPDLYEVGMSYLGTKILYGLINKRDDCLCERVFAPWADFEEALRRLGEPLFSLESRKALSDFDIAGFSITYELNYTNVVNMLDLGHIPINASERSDKDPIVIAGGTSCYNPEPVAQFIDAFIIGDGEDVFPEVVDLYKKFRCNKDDGGGRKCDRAGFLKALCGIKGVYVPSLYSVEYNPDNTISRFFPVHSGAPAVIEKRYVEDLDAAYYPTDQIVPYIQIVHDRIILEILRGCKHACKFCLSGFTCLPWRKRSKARILELAKEAYEKTGYEEMSVLSLSSGDHPEIVDIIKELNETFSGKAVSVSFPSLRIRDTLKELPSLISSVRKTGLTFAPESGSQRLRKMINKDIDFEELLMTAKESFRSGWNKVKLYFIVGLPTETEEDVLSILDLALKVSDIRKEVDSKRANVTVSVNAFMPKPHTPLERYEMESMEKLGEKRRMLRERCTSKMVKLDFNSFEKSYLEEVFSRGDRRLYKVIVEAWKNGARFDGWPELFNFKLWQDAFKISSIDPDFYALRRRSDSEVLPWDFIDAVPRKNIA